MAEVNETEMGPENPQEPQEQGPQGPQPQGIAMPVEFTNYVQNAITMATHDLYVRTQELLNHNNTLRAQNATQELQLRTQNAQIEELKKKLERFAQSPNTSQVKLSKPTEFTGDKDSISIEVYATQLALYMSQWPLITDRQKITTALSFLKGSAAKWAQKYVIELDTKPISFEDWSKEFETMWGQDDREGKAIRELETLKQGSSSVPEYAAAFKQKAALTKYSDYDLRLKFRSGLQTRIKEQLAHIPASEKDTLKKLIDYSIQIGRNYEELDAEKKKSNWWTPNKETPKPSITQGRLVLAKTVTLWMWTLASRGDLPNPKESLALSPATAVENKAT